MGTHSPSNMSVTQTSYCTLHEMPDRAQEIYTSGCIPLICGVDEEQASAVSTFWQYKGDTVLDTKPLVGLSMSQGKTAAWEKVTTSASFAVDKGRTLVLHMGDGGCDFVHPDFQVYVVSQFVEEDILDFFEWGPFPL